MLYAIEEHAPELIGDGHFVADNATVIGQVTLQARSSVWFNAVIRGDNDRITIGEDSNVQDAAVLHTDAGIQLTVGPRVTIGHQAMLHGCTIGENSLIGIQAVVLNGARIGRNCIIGAGSLVGEGKTIPDNTLWMGTPARQVKELTDAQAAMLRAAAEHYVGNARRYRETLRAID